MGQGHRQCSCRWRETWYCSSIQVTGGSWTRGQSTLVLEEGYVFSGLVYDTRALDPYVAYCETPGLLAGLWGSEGTLFE